MNWKRIILGGLVAGLIINMSQGALHEGLLKDTWSTSMQALGKTGEFSGGQIAVFNIMGFLTGIALVWALRGCPSALRRRPEDGNVLRNDCVVSRLRPADHRPDRDGSVAIQRVDHCDHLGLGRNDCGRACGVLALSGAGPGDLIPEAGKRFRQPSFFERSA